MHESESRQVRFPFLIQNSVLGNLEESLSTVGSPIEQKPPSGDDRRRSRRLVLTVPVTLEWKNERGEVMRALASAHNVSIHGGSIHLADEKRSPAVNAEIALKNILSGDTCHARVIRARRLASGSVPSLAVELIEAPETFWGLTFQLQQTTMQLLDIEKAFQTRPQDLDLRVLRSLAEAVEYLRAVSSIVHQWQELSVMGKNAYSVLDPLSSARVNKAIHLLRDLTADIDASELTINTEEFSGLLQAVERLHVRMTRGTKTFPELK
jgi:hypothetical protein